MANGYGNAADNECNSGPLPNRHLLEEMRYWHDSKREAGEERGDLCAELCGSVFGCEFPGH